MKSLLRKLFERPSSGEDGESPAGFEMMCRFDNGYSASFMGNQLLTNDDLKVFETLADISSCSGFKTENPAGVPFFQLGKYKINKERWWNKQWNAIVLKTSCETIAKKAGLTCDDEHIARSLERLWGVAILISDKTHRMNYWFDLFQDCTGTLDNLEISICPIVYEILLGDGKNA